MSFLLGVDPSRTRLLYTYNTTALIRQLSFFMISPVHIFGTCCLHMTIDLITI